MVLDFELGMNEVKKSICESSSEAEHLITNEGAVISKFIFRSNT